MQLGYKPEEIYLLFKKYCKDIAHIGSKNIIKLILGLIVHRKIVINGLNDGRRIEEIINMACNEKGIENINQIKMPLLIPSVNLHDGSLYVFSSKVTRGEFSDEIKYINDMNIGKAVHASCSYPGVFSPCMYGDIELIDGGVRENVPWRETKKVGADFVIGVVFKKCTEKRNAQNVIEVVSTSIDLLAHELSSYELHGLDYSLNIKTKKISLLDIKEIDYLYEKGYQEALSNIENIKKLIK